MSKMSSAKGAAGCKPKIENLFNSSRKTAMNEKVHGISSKIDDSKKKKNR